MQIKVNGEDRDLPDGETVRALVTRYNLTPEKVAVELNRRLLRGDKYDTALKNGDEVEIVTFVGGGKDRGINNWHSFRQKAVWSLLPRFFGERQLLMRQS